MASKSVKKFKLVMVGDGAVGKTSLVKRHLTGEFNPKYKATIGFDVNFMQFYTTAGFLTFEIWDTAGQEKTGVLKDAYFHDADAAIIMFDLTAMSTYKHVEAWYQDLIRVAPKIAIVVCGNKAEMKERKVKDKKITFPRKKRLMYLDISVKANYNIERPYLYLAQALMDDPSLSFLKFPTAVPAETPMTDDQVARLEKQRKEAQSAPLPDEDEEEDL